MQHSHRAALETANCESALTASQGGVDLSPVLCVTMEDALLLDGQGVAALH